MKKLIFAIAFTFTSIFAHAQTLGYLDLPVVGEVWIEFKDTIGSNFAITPAGLGQTWNYLSSFNVNDTLVFQPQMTSTVPSNISSLYPQSTLVDVGEVAGDFNFFKIDFTGMYLDGLHSDNGYLIASDTLSDINYANDLLYLPIPFQSGDVVQNNSTFDYTFPDPTFGAGALVRVTYSTFQDFEADAQGELTTPLGYYNSVIRIKQLTTKSVLYEVDTFATGIFSFLTQFDEATRTSYKWIKNGPNCLVMTSEYDEFNNILSASYFTSSGLVANKNGKQQAQISIMPNPVKAGNNLNVNLNQDEANTLIVYDLNGRELSQTIVPKGTARFALNTEKFESGIYYLKVFNQKQQAEVLKLVVTQ